MLYWSTVALYGAIGRDFVEDWWEMAGRRDLGFVDRNVAMSKIVGWIRREFVMVSVVVSLV